MFFGSKGKKSKEASSSKETPTKTAPTISSTPPKIGDVCEGLVMLLKPEQQIVPEMESFTINAVLDWVETGEQVPSVCVTHSNTVFWKMEAIRSDGTIDEERNVVVQKAHVNIDIDADAAFWATTEWCFRSVSDPDSEREIKIGSATFTAEPLSSSSPNRRFRVRCGEFQAIESIPLGRYRVTASFSAGETSYNKEDKKVEVPGTVVGSWKTSLEFDLA